MVAWQTPAQRRKIQRRRPNGRFMTKSTVIGLVLMVACVCAYGTAPDWLACRSVCSDWR
jgi:hypothetical protein